jgi:hypothetical protein
MAATPAAGTGGGAIDPCPAENKKAVARGRFCGYGLGV